MPSWKLRASEVKKSYNPARQYLERVRGQKYTSGNSNYAVDSVVSSSAGPADTVARGAAQRLEGDVEMGVADQVASGAAAHPGTSEAADQVTSHSHMPLWRTG